MNRAKLLPAMAGIVVFAVGYSAESPSPVQAAGATAATAIAAAPAFAPGKLVALPRDGWPTNGGNLWNQRYSPLTQINRDNVAGLKAVWRASLRGSGLDTKHSGQAQPLVYEGVLYIVTGNNDVFAISIDTGEVLWEYEAHLNPDEVVTCCGWASRGVGMGDGKIFVGQLDNKVVALDQKTGRVVWRTQSQTLADGGYSITMAPLYYDGMVFIGHSGGDMGTRGVIKAFDAATGKERWRWNTVPAPGEPGSETWPKGSDVWKYGGGAVWSTPAVDPELGLIYFPVANPAPDLNGAVREGDNLYTSSIVALDAKTGKYRWHYQYVHHDIWDYGGANPVVLFDVNINGQLRKGLSHAPKSGYVYILDRITGKPLVGIEERPVPQLASQKTARTQPIPIGDDVMPHCIDIAPEGYDLVNDGCTFTPFADDPIVYKQPAGVNWPPSSYDPQTGLMFICANDGIGVVRRSGEKFDPPAIGEPYLGGAFGRTDAVRRGILAALDVTTQKLAWRRQWSDGCSGGSVNTAGGLLFIGRGDGRLMAYDKRDGQALWEFQTDAPVNAPPTVFEYKGTQYVAVLAAGQRYSPHKRGDGVWLFSLNGKIGPLPPGSATSPPATAAPTKIADGPADIENGHKVYGRICTACHGPTGEGSHGQGTPFKPHTSAADIALIASAGRKDMPSFAGVLSPEELRDVAGYIAENLVKK